MKLPYGDSARPEQIIRKVETYSLNLDHLKGRHKARLFKAKLGITVSNKEVLLTALLKQAARSEAVSYSRSTEYGDCYQIDFELTTESGSSTVRSAWIIYYGKTYPHLMSVYPV